MKQAGEVPKESTVSDTNRIVGMVSGVDWITVTGTDLGRWDKIQNLAYQLLEQGFLNGETIRKSSRHGFSLKGVAGVQYGSGAGGWMVSLSGDEARRHWMAFAVFAKNVTRLDLQVTVWYNSDQVDTIRNLHKEALRNASGKPKRNLTHIDNGKKGSTLYIGSRASSQFGRIYDKQRQQKNKLGFQNAIRFEVEYKKPLSKEVCRWLMLQERTPDEMAARVLDWFAARGIEVPQIGTSADNAIQVGKEPTPLENKLNWLRKTVRPVYRQLVALGYQVEADGSIGITDDLITYGDEEA